MAGYRHSAHNHPQKEWVGESGAEPRPPDVHFQELELKHLDLFFFSALSLFLFFLPPSTEAEKQRKKVKENTAQNLALMQQGPARFKPGSIHGKAVLYSSELFHQLPLQLRLALLDIDLQPLYLAGWKQPTLIHLFVGSLSQTNRYVL